MRTATKSNKTFSLDKEILLEVKRTKGMGSESERVNKLLKFALDIEKTRGKRSPKSGTPTYAVKVENVRTRHSAVYYGGPGRAWVAEFLSDLIAGEFGQP